MRFNKALTHVLFSDLKDDGGPVGKAMFAIDWESAPIASVRMGANDFVEMTQDISGDDLAAIDKVLEGCGAYTLSQARDKNYRRAIQLLSFSRIKKESDAFLIKGIVATPDARFSDEQIAALDMLLETYAE